MWKFFNRMVDHITCLPCGSYNFSPPFPQPSIYFKRQQQLMTIINKNLNLCIHKIGIIYIIFKKLKIFIIITLMLSYVNVAFFSI